MPKYQLDTYDRGELRIEATPLDPRWNEDPGVTLRVVQGSFMMTRNLGPAEVMELVAELLGKNKEAIEKHEADKPRREQQAAEREIERLQRELDKAREEQGEGSDS